jgi:hypothetical protein
MESEMAMIYFRDNPSISLEVLRKTMATCQKYLAAGPRMEPWTSDMQSKVLITQFSCQILLKEPADWTDCATYHAINLQMPFIQKGTAEMITILLVFTSCFNNRHGVISTT